VTLGPILVRTIRHFCPDLNDWLDRVPDSRDQAKVIYDRRFLLWWGIALYLFQLGSRRQLDFDLASDGTQVLDNLNRLAGTEQTSRPVHDTLDHFLGHSRVSALGHVRTQMLQRLIRMKVLDAARLQGCFVVVLDGTGFICCRQRHCVNCLVQRHGNVTLYMHQVLEAKLLGPGGLTLSLGSAFIENDAQTSASAEEGRSAEDRKQDCELKACERLAPELKRAHPRLPICLAGDGLMACGRLLLLCRICRWHYVLTFKEGRLPTVWAEFQQLLVLCPQNRLERTLPDGTQQVYRWVENLSYTDSEGRQWTFHAIECVETVDGQTTRFAWITDLHVSARTVVAIAERGGRPRWCIENEGFNRQKNSGMNLGHVFSTDPEKLKAYYVLLQIAHILVQLLECGSLLWKLAASIGQTPWQWLGSLKNLARRLLESVRNAHWPAECYERPRRASIQIRLNDSS
jgi:hypothetical protein